ncbi:MAG TPA: endonuclease domain-containing protein [Xanthomonadaceae bacterium]|nr:endonuclease domain-containing protein [Xanthomonadaceae bacterium]
MRQGAKRDFARKLRRDMTDAEQRLWYRLRRRQLNGHRFRRQHPIGPYIVDFVCLESRLIIELDGSQHLESSNDVTRAAFLVANGFRLLRFWNDDVLLRTESVLQAVWNALEGGEVNG